VSVEEPTRIARRRWQLAAGSGVLLFAIVISTLFHVRPLFREHREGDEIVYLTLAREMNWDLSHYTTMDDPVVRDFPWTIYREPLFIHPPLLPLILKAAIALRHPVAYGLLVEYLAALALLYFGARAARFHGYPGLRTAALLVAFAGCPLIVFSTTYLHHDALAGVLLFGGLTLFVESLETGSRGMALAAGLLLALAFNIRYTLIAALPLLGFVQWWGLERRRAASGERWREVAGKARNWSTFAIVVAIVGSIGLQHFYRVFATYGTLLPYSIFGFEPERANDFVRDALSVTRLQMASWLLLLFPAWMLWLAPRRLAYLARMARARSWEFAFFVVTIFLFAVVFLRTYNQLRYFALVAPFAHLALTSPLFRGRDCLRGVLTPLLLGTTAVLAVATSVLAILPIGAKLIPAALFLVPFLRLVFG